MEHWTKINCTFEVIVAAAAARSSPKSRGAANPPSGEEQMVWWVGSMGGLDIRNHLTQYGKHAGDGGGGGDLALTTPNSGRSNNHDDSSGGTAHDSPIDAGESTPTTKPVGSGASGWSGGGNDLLSGRHPRGWGWSRWKRLEG
ncbi:hypothetical protein GUJ93_ZPchr0009g1128 [Zizania palustris]|uniref:Uncharacterized protein n=1 Tax=Zizania palustris TaxID=103762 RepID=A0A8J5RQD8_ZIZPA|nr:hypothetical protein GUJ93_ZPchr0009g1128 [Zizania palustris]